MADTATIGQRFYAIRLALGDGVRKAMPMREFVALVKKRTGREIHASELSGIERDTRKVVDVNDVAAVAAVDPLRRGRDWLAWGLTPGEIRVDVSSIEAVPDPDAGLDGIQHPPQQPASRRRGGAGAKDHGSVKKHPPS